MTETIPLSTSRKNSTFAGVPDLLIQPESGRQRYERYRKAVYYFLERPENKFAIVYHIINLVLIVGSIITSIFSTIESYENDEFLINLILYYELALLSWFTVEYFCRVWSCSFLGKYKGLFGRLRFMKTLYMMIDAFVIISTLTTAILSVKTAYFTILRITRFLQIFRILRLDRQRGDLRTMGRVVYKHRKELVTCYFVGFIILFGGTYLIYVIEKVGAEASTIDNMANGLYWAMITVTSVGYGDISPETWAGKLITGVFALVGCAFFALPAGILGSGFALQVAKQKKQRRYIKVRNPAAIVIQTCWRNHAVSAKRYQNQGTWHYFFPQLLGGRGNTPSYYDCLPGVRNILNTDIIPNKYKKAINDELNNKNKKIIKNPFKSITKRRQSNISNGSTGASLDITERLFSVASKSRKLSSISRKKSSADIPLSNILNRQYKEAIRFVLRVKLFTAIKIFKNVRYPFVNVQDIMEKNALCHTETLSHLKHIQDSLSEFRGELKAIQCFMDQIRNNNFVDVTSPKSSVGGEDDGQVLLFSQFISPDTMELDNECEDNEDQEEDDEEVLGEDQDERNVLHIEPEEAN